jgi:hypothetical protein
VGASFYLHLIFNAYWKKLTFELPLGNGRGPAKWKRLIDTRYSYPEDICAWADAPIVQSEIYLAQPRSIVLLATRIV